MHQSTTLYNIINKVFPSILMQFNLHWVHSISFITFQLLCPSDCTGVFIRERQVNSLFFLVFYVTHSVYQKRLFSNKITLNVSSLVTFHVPLTYFNYLALCIWNCLKFILILTFLTSSVFTEQILMLLSFLPPINILPTYLQTGSLL